MPEMIPTLNAPVASVEAAAAPVDSSSTDATQAQSPGADTATSSGETQNTQAADTGTSPAKEQDTTSAPGEAGAEADAGKLDRFDKHPRFQELVKSNRELKARLAEIEKRATEAPQPKEEPKGSSIQDKIKEITGKMEMGELSLDEANMQMFEAMQQATLLAAEARITEKNREFQTQERAEQMKQDFLTQYPDFEDMRDGPEVQAILEKNPMMDPISAYFAVKVANAEKETAVKIKAAEDKVRKEIAAKPYARTLTATRGATAPDMAGVPLELKEPNKFGGTTAVLARRLEARRAAAS